MGFKTTFLDPIDFHCVNTNILQSMFFRVPQKRECHRGLERHKVRNLNFWVNYNFKEKVSHTLHESTVNISVLSVY